MPTPKISVKSIMNGFERKGGNDVKPFGAWVAAGLPIPARSEAVNDAAASCAGATPPSIP